MHILVADDQPDVRRVVRLLLSREEGWHVTEVADGDAAVAAYDDGGADAAVLDQRMPGRTGTEVAAVLRDRGFTGPIIVFSAYLEPSVLREAQRLGVETVAKGDIVTLVDVLRTAAGG